MIDKTRRKALWLAASMGATALLAVAWKPRRAMPDAASQINLSQVFPGQFGQWRVDAGAESLVRPPDPQVTEYKIYDQVLEHTYIDAQGYRIMLSVAFGAEQSAGLQMHRPEVCYQSSGFQVQDTHAASLSLAGQSVPVTRLHARRPGRSEPITYWTVLGDMVTADGNSFRLRQLSFGLRRQLLDGMLVRISSIEADSSIAYSRHAGFAGELALALAPDMRPRVIGRKPEG